MKKKVLIIAAHPDDEILGCGGTIARLVSEGYQAYTLILGEGVAARYEKPDAGRQEEEIRELKKQADIANGIIGVKEVFLRAFSDNRFDTAPFLDIVKAVEEVKKEIRPNILFTHYADDLNIDHQITYKAVITGTRPVPGETVKEVYSFEVLSSTEWNYPASFSPDVFFDISATLKTKIKAMEAYKSELKEFPHSRSIEGIRSNARHWGMKAGLECAEAFKCARIIK